MTLDQYLCKSGITAAAFGAQCDPPISEASISRIRRGEQNISRDVMLSLIAASAGKITAHGLLIAPTRTSSEQAAA